MLSQWESIAHNTEMQTDTEKNAAASEEWSVKCQVCLCLFMSHALNIFDISLNTSRNTFCELHEEIECYVVFLATNFCNSNISGFALNCG